MKVYCIKIVIPYQDEFNVGKIYNTIIEHDEYYYISVIGNNGNKKLFFNSKSSNHSYEFKIYFKILREVNLINLLNNI